MASGSESLYLNWCLKSQNIWYVLSHVGFMFVASFFPSTIMDIMGWLAKNYWNPISIFAGQNPCSLAESMFNDTSGGKKICFQCYMWSLSCDSLKDIQCFLVWFGSNVKWEDHTLADHTLADHTLGRRHDAARVGRPNWRNESSSWKMMRFWIILLSLELLQFIQCFIYIYIGRIIQ